MEVWLYVSVVGGSDSIGVTVTWDTIHRGVHVPRSIVSDQLRVMQTEWMLDTPFGMSSLMVAALV